MSTTAAGPIVGGIPFLRSGREELQSWVAARLERGNEEAAVVELLRDQDDWAPGPAPTVSAARRVVRGDVSLRDAMDLLSFGPVADYFAFRPGDPTFLSGLALLRAHWRPRVFELACGIGHFGRELSRHGVAWTGADVVWAKLWLARRYVVGHDVPLVCFDAASPFPLADGTADAAFCHDALYFLPDRPHVVGELRRIAPTVLIGHAHTPSERHPAGDPLTLAGYRALFCDPVVYDDAELTRALLEDRPPCPGAGDEAPAVAFAEGAVVAGPDLGVPVAGTRLRANPLVGPDGLPVWPSPRYAAEYGPLSGYLRAQEALPAQARAGDSPRVDGLARRRLLLDLPERW